ncbi:MAG TPA: class I SAM-dependent methyltransferase [Solirubrobacteraceae bacterium]|jgi:ubiquinone/menaquinone biosynthesis C-methylase UbiE|nr:class I SAM-dependent methyltransferase [Solirubrobacteraceae bacterium]
MNENHDRVCPSPEWAEYLQSEVLPRVVDGIELGTRMLEIGPGPGASTDWLRRRVDQLVALELDEEAAAKLADRFADAGNVEVRAGDATQIPWPDASFDSVGCFTMLHHVPTVALQNRVLAEAHRVLRPGGMLVASDSVHSVDLHHFHEDDVYNPIDPGTLFTRLQTIGFDYITVGVEWSVHFRARKPPPAKPPAG